MPPRLAPALGLTAACAMLTGIGLLAIDQAASPQQPTSLAGAVTLPSSASVRTTASSRPVVPHSTSTPAAAAATAAPLSRTQTTAPSSPPIATASPTSGAEAIAQAVFEAINRARAAQQLAPLVWSSGLQQSARSHNRAMASSATLSHQVDGEPALGSRENSAGVRWTYAAENIGWTTERSRAGVLDIEARMLAETAPNDAHRRNLLSRRAQLVGVDVYYDAVHSRLWLTEDFAGDQPSSGLAANDGNSDGSSDGAD